MFGALRVFLGATFGGSWKRAREKETLTRNATLWNPAEVECEDLWGEASGGGKASWYMPCPGAQT